MQVYWEGFSGIAFFQLGWYRHVEFDTKSGRLFPGWKPITKNSSFWEVPAGCPFINDLVQRLNKHN